MYTKLEAHVLAIHMGESWFRIMNDNGRLSDENLKHALSMLEKHRDQAINIRIYEDKRNERATHTMA